eukprot:TRINITY_DN5780_c0_g1_i4.p1 TRINITY_DN5780_c0_g1~~TRINITY_DN5780_c0_g1_i4.p1  ORF type:complete len:147 (-),score=22.57 TRINITY_DN5780_c0_g1_i4:163-603(-)
MMNYFVSNVRSHDSRRRRTTAAATATAATAAAATATATATATAVAMTHQRLPYLRLSRRCRRDLLAPLSDVYRVKEYTWYSANPRATGFMTASPAWMLSFHKAAANEEWVISLQDHEGFRQALIQACCESNSPLGGIIPAMHKAGC